MAVLASSSSDLGSQRTLFFGLSSSSDSPVFAGAVVDGRFDALDLIARTRRGERAPKVMISEREREMSRHAVVTDRKEGGGS